MTRQLAAEVGPHVRLTDLLTTEVRFQRLSIPTSFPLDAILAAAVDPMVRRDGVDFRCLITAEIRDGVGEDDQDDEPSSVIFEATIGFLVQYDTDPEVAEGFTREQLEAFANHSVLFSVHPYLRQRLDDMTGWAGLPRLVLGTALQPLDVPDET